MSLDPETLLALDEIAGGRGSRSRLIEAAVLEYVMRRRTRRRDSRDRAVLDAHAEELARMMDEVLGDQADP